MTTFLWIRDNLVLARVGFFVPRVKLRTRLSTGSMLLSSLKFSQLAPTWGFVQLGAVGADFSVNKIFPVLPVYVFRWYTLLWAISFTRQRTLVGFSIRRTRIKVFVSNNLEIVEVCQVKFTRAGKPSEPKLRGFGPSVIKFTKDTVRALPPYRDCVHFDIGWDLLISRPRCSWGGARTRFVHHWSYLKGLLPSLSFHESPVMLLKKDKCWV